MNIIDSHIHICRCINGFGNSGEMPSCGHALFEKQKNEQKMLNSEQKSINGLWESVLY